MPWRYYCTSEQIITEGMYGYLGGVKVRSTVPAPQLFALRNYDPLSPAKSAAVDALDEDILLARARLNGQVLRLETTAGARPDFGGAGDRVRRHRRRHRLRP